MCVCRDETLSKTFQTRSQISDREHKLGGTSERCLPTVACASKKTPSRAFFDVVRGKTCPTRCRTWRRITTAKRTVEVSSAVFPRRLPRRVPDATVTLDFLRRRPPRRPSHRYHRPPSRPLSQHYPPNQPGPVPLNRRRLRSAPRTTMLTTVERRGAATCFSGSRKASGRGTATVRRRRRRRNPKAAAATRRRSSVLRNTRVFTRR